MPQKETIAGIIVTYHPDSGFVRRFSGLREQVDRVVVVDNASGPECVSMLREAAARLEWRLILNDRNLGLAAALNAGVADAIISGYRWALLFDQDTTPGEGMVEGLRAAYLDFPRKDRLAVIGSNYTAHREALRSFPAVCQRRCWTEQKVLITSGSLLSLRVYAKLGPFVNKYFIDCVDLEYCLRARCSGFEVIMTTQPLMIHEIGRPIRHRLPWRDIAVTNHVPARWYYMIRNDVDMARKYVLRQPAGVLTSLWTRFKALVLLCVFEENRCAKLRYSIRGMLDGLHAKFDRNIGWP
jgi:rhamnosyltransferase